MCESSLGLWNGGAWTPRMVLIHTVAACSEISRTYNQMCIYVVALIFFLENLRTGEKSKFLEKT